MVLKRTGVLIVLIGALTGCETLVMPGSPGVVPVGAKQSEPDASRQPVIFDEPRAIPEPQAQEAATVTPERRQVSTPHPFEDAPAQDHRAARLPVVSKLLGQCESLMAQSNWPQAQQRLEQALRMAPQDPEIFLLYGDWYAQQADKDGAREMYQRARALAGKGTREAQRASEKLEQLTWH